MLAFFMIAIAFALLFASFRYHNILLSLGGAICWLVLWRQNMVTPITTDTVSSEWLSYLYIGMAMTWMLIFFLRRGRASNLPNGSSPNGSVNFDSGLPYQNGESTPNWSDDANEYRQKVRGALRQRRPR